MRAEKGDAAYLQDMIDSAETVARYIGFKSRADFDRDEMLRDAIARRVESFGEAARGLSEAIQLAHPEIPWRKIRAHVTFLRMNMAKWMKISCGGSPLSTYRTR